MEVTKVLVVSENYLKYSILKLLNILYINFERLLKVNSNETQHHSLFTELTKTIKRISKCEI